MWFSFTSAAVTSGAKEVTVTGADAYAIRGHDALLISGFPPVEIAAAVNANTLVLRQPWPYDTATAEASVLPTFGDFNNAIANVKNVGDFANKFLMQLHHWMTTTNPTAPIEDPVGNVTPLLTPAAIGMGAATGNKGFSVRRWTGDDVSIGVSDHATWIMADRQGQAGEVNTVRVGSAIATQNEESYPARGTTIFITQNSATPLVLLAQAGITIVGAGQKMAFGEGSTITLTAIEGDTWVLGGDVKPSNVVV
ncbi:hypothetical protein K6Y31_20680 [Motilimonas cestriensis]|uniref:Minor tail protein n=1 Tax=Motilimonas cestriensis TaxID=2742685 RepID=A0ABS8WF52_9GAMM|nr:hypothetical protein [Motilimonas cestriensis]MCE2597193.1 hypothetical protein [Motilimonas cestriensis]